MKTISLKSLKILSIAFIFMLCSGLYAGNSNGNWGKANHGNSFSSNKPFKKKKHISKVNSKKFNNKKFKKKGFFFNFFNFFNKEKKHKNKKNPKHPSVPLDGGLSILLLGAAAFGVRKLHSKK